ncbi:MAG: M28 family peptidase [Balneola sp.]|jgi:Zn-dependent M28 family amino/carboxypeptidase
MKKLLLLLIIPVLACSQKPAVKLDTNQLIEDLRFISSDVTEGRRTGTEGNRIAREHLVTRFQEEGAEPFQNSYTHEFTFENRRTQEEVNGINVIAQIDGKTDSMIVITAHYDHLGIRDSLIFNGADDDASGTAALLAMADYFAKEQPNHTLIFAAFDAEEMGLQGARAFVEDSVILSKVKLNINMDMISNNDSSEIYAAGTYHYPETKPVLESIDTAGLKLLFGHDTPDLGYNDWTFSSDHGPFHSKGIPFVYFGVEDHENYHKATDEFETIPQEFYKSSVQLILNAVLAFDKQ